MVEGLGKLDVCCVLYKAVIVSIPTDLQQSDNPGKVNPRNAAAAVSMHDDSTHNRHSIPVRHVGGDLIKQHAVFKGFHLEKKYIIMLISPCYRFVSHVC